ncbi:MAG: HDOD domain-containing protein [Acidimicrobiia bacterium]
MDLDALAEAAACLEPLPASVTRLASLVSNGDPDLAEIAEIVGYDQALTASLLRSANSSWSASRTSITTVRDAVIRLGYGTVLSLALGVNVRKRMQQSLPEYGLAEGDLWRHSVAASLAAEVMPRHTRVRIPNEATTAALLHDVGKLVMGRFLDAAVLETLERAQEQGGVSRRVAESEILGVHHGELGGLIAQSWGLPEAITQGITYHHDPDECAEPITLAVHVADVIAKTIGAGNDDNTDPEASLFALEALQLSPDQFETVSATVSERFEEVMRRY